MSEKKCLTQKTIASKFSNSENKLNCRLKHFWNQLKFKYTFYFYFHSLAVVIVP